MSQLKSRGEAARGNVGLKRSFKSFMEKLRQTVSHVARETLDDSDTDYETGAVNQMFSETAEGEEDNILRDRYDSNDRSEATDIRLSINSETLAPRSETDEEIGEEAKVTFEVFDPVVECAKFRRNTEGPFTGGPAIWEQRRKLWLKTTKENHINEAEEAHVMFMNISPRNYYAIYKKLVCEDAPLKHSLNLKDVVKIINAGWVESSTWEKAAKGLG